MIEENRNNLSNSGLSRSMEQWPLRKFDNFDQEFMKKKVSKSQNRPSLGDFPKFLEHYGGFQNQEDIPNKWVSCLDNKSNYNLSVKHSKMPL